MATKKEGVIEAQEKCKCAPYISPRSPGSVPGRVRALAEEGKYALTIPSSVARRGTPPARLRVPLQ